MSSDKSKSKTSNNLTGLRKMYANAKPVINPEHQYDRQGTFLRIKDLLEERARALNQVQSGDRQPTGWKPQSFEDKYIYPFIDDITPRKSNSLVSKNAQSHGKGSSKSSIASTSSKKPSIGPVPAKKNVSPNGPERTVFRGQKSFPYSAYSSTYGTYPNHAILSVGNTEQGVPRWEIRAVQRDGPMQDTPVRRKVTIDEKPKDGRGKGRKIEKMSAAETKRAIKSILKKGTTVPETPEMENPLETPLIPRERINPNLRRQTSSEELMMIAKESTRKREAAKSTRIPNQRLRLPVIKQSTLDNPNGPVVTWMQPTFVNAANSDMIAIPDAILERMLSLSQDISPSISASGYDSRRSRSDSQKSAYTRVDSEDTF